MNPSTKLRKLLVDIEQHSTNDRFFLGQLHGQLSEITETIEDQERAYQNLCKLYLCHKPKILDECLKTVEDVVTERNLKGEDTNE